MLLRSNLTITKTIFLPVLFLLSLLCANPVLAVEKHIQGTVLDHLTRQGLDQVTVGVFRNDELVHQQFLAANEPFSISFDYNEGDKYSLIARKKDYSEENILLSRALLDDTIPENMVLSLAKEPMSFQFTGNTRDRDTATPVPNVKVKQTNKMTGEVIETASDYQGNYTFRVVSGYEYDVVISNRDFLKRHASINYCKDKLGENNKYCFRGFADVSLDSKGGVSAATSLLDKIEIGKKFVVDNIYYDYNKATLREDGLPNLDRVFHILMDNPQLSIELGSHADSRGSDAYNLKLSQNRAEAAVDYIIGQGVAEPRISAKGYGEEALLNHCKNSVKCSDAEHEQNRRTEFTITEIDKQAIVE